MVRRVRLDRPGFAADPLAMHRIALLILLLAAGCAPQQAGPAMPRGDRALPPPGLSERSARGGCADHAAALPALVGRPEAEVRRALSAMPGIGSIQMLAPDQPATRDYRHDRVRGLVRGGLVERLACG